MKIAFVLFCIWLRVILIFAMSHHVFNVQFSKNGEKNESIDKASDSYFLRLQITCFL